MTERTYEVGYGKPPKEHQFPKGTSGFAGRKHQKKKKPVTQYLDDLLAEMVPVVDGGKKKMMTKLELFFHQLITRALNNDRTATKFLLGYALQRQSAGPADDNSQTDDFLIAQLKSLMGSQEGKTEEEEDGDAVA